MIKKIIYILWITLFTVSIKAQDKTKQDNVVNIFVKDYNTGKYDDFYNYFSSSLQNNITLSTFERFLTEMRENLGSIIKIDFYGINDDASSLFKTEFEKKIVLVNFSFDEQDNVLGFRILDYTDKDEIREKIAGLSLENIINAASESLKQNQQLAVAIIKNGETTYFGLENKRGKIKSIDNKNNFFRIGTFTSIFTNNLLAQSVAEKKIELSENINSYYPEPFKNNLKISFSSLASGKNELSFFPPEYLLSEIASEKRKQNIPFGNPLIAHYLENDIVLDTLDKKSNFSILGTSILGDALVRVNNKPYSELFKQGIVDRYQLHNTSLFKTKKMKFIEPAVKNTKYLSTDSNNIDFFFPSTQGISTISDIGKYLQYYFEGNFPELKIMEKPLAMFASDDWVSLGWRINFFQTNESIYFHRGVDVSYASFISFSPNRKEAIVIMINDVENESINLIENLSYELWSKLVFDTAN